jgi:hypothetical protein
VSKNKITGIIVDGDGDYASIKSRYKNTKLLKTDGPRGHSSNINDIVSGSRKQISMLMSLGCSTVIVVLDFEKRNKRYKLFLKEITNAFNKFYNNDSIKVVIPNIMIENWYLADVENLSKKRVYIKDNLKQKSYEGKHGKNEIKKIFKQKYTYNEVKHGPQLFGSIRKEVAIKNSESFNEFTNLI